MFLSFPIVNTNTDLTGVHQLHNMTAVANPISIQIALDPYRKALLMMNLLGNASCFISTRILSLLRLLTADILNGFEPNFLKIFGGCLSFKLKAPFPHVDHWSIKYRYNIL